MHLTILAVPDCPNAPVLDDLVAAVLEGRAGVSVSHEVISDESEAARWGMHGSPTLLIDGADPLAGPGQPQACHAGCTAMTAARRLVCYPSASCGR